MLVVCNGAFKSGSTWLYEVASALVPSTPIGPPYLNAEWFPVASIRPRYLRAFVRDVDIRRDDYVTKQHLERVRHREILLGREEIRVLNIRREIHDVLASAYHHFVALGYSYEGFADYYWHHGRYTADHIRRHHNLWDVDGVLTVAYEELLASFEVSVARLADFLGATATGAGDVRAIEEKTSLQGLRARYRHTGMSSMPSELFFREGAAGGGAALFDDAMNADLETVMTGCLSAKARVQWAVRRRLVVARQAAGKLLGSSG